MTEDKTNPLLGRRIIATGTPVEAQLLRAELAPLGAVVLEWPMFVIKSPTHLREFAQLVQDAHSYDWVCFTSAEGVDAFFELFYKLYDDAREIGGAKFIAIGTETAARLKAFRFRIDLEVVEPAGETMPRKLEEAGGVENLRVLVVQEEEARDVLTKKISAMGGIVDEGFAYRIVPATREAGEVRPPLFEQGADLITFTTSRAIENFLTLGLPLPNETRVASSSAAISKRARAGGMRVEMEAKCDDGGLGPAIKKYFHADV